MKPEHPARVGEGVQPKISIRGIAKGYGHVKALQATTLSVEAGEFLTLLGPSGSGKTTLLMLIAGLISPDSGDIFIDGRPATHEPPYSRDIGLVFQSYALFPHLTVFENIAFPLRMRRVAAGEITRRVTHALELVQLPHVADRLPRELSGGQQQRVAFARCAVYRPSVILMDEPLGALDKKLRDQMQIEIKRLHQVLGTTIIYVTHDQEEAMAMSDRICLMNEGAIEQLGSPQELYFRPRSVFVADFLGHSNIYPARREDVGRDSVRLRGPGGTLLLASPVERELGDELSCMIRPEHIRPLGEAEVEDNSLCAILEQSIATGPLTRIFARLDDGQPMVATMLTLDPELLEPGTPLRLGWSRRHTVLLPSARAP